MFTANNLYPFLTHFFICKIDICLTKTFFGIHFTFIGFPRLPIHKIDLCKQSSMTWCCSNQSMSISTSYDPKGKIFKYILAGKSFKFTSQFLTISKIFLFIPVDNCTLHGFSLFNFSSLHVSTILGDT